MIASLADWHSAIDPLVPPDAIPDHPDLGALYPWREVALHARSSLHRRRVEIAKLRLAEVCANGSPWLGWSAGKDSTSLAALCVQLGLSPRVFAQKDDLDYPGEEAYIRNLAGMTLRVDMIRPPDSVFEAYVRQVADPTTEIHARGTAISDAYFYGLLDRHRREHDYHHVLLGLRAEESSARNVNRASHGWDYTRASGLRVSCPLADWSDLDVHAYLASRDVPLLPVYLCIDPGAGPLRIRKSWWVVGGPAARHGHYRWLRRWWPKLHGRLSARVPGVTEVS